MGNRSLKQRPAFRVMEGLYAVCRLGADVPIPEWAYRGSFFSITRTVEELSVIVKQTAVPAEAEDGLLVASDFRGMVLSGPLDFDAIGILAGISANLAAAAVSIFAVSTYDTDYVFVKEADLGRAVNALVAGGYRLDPPE
jgi:hypothetical protein